MPGQKVTQPQIADTYQRILDEAGAASGRDAQIENRNYNREINRELERVQEFLRVMGDADLAPLIAVEPDE